MTAAIAGVLDLPLGIVHHVNQAFFLARFKDFKGFVFGDFTCQTFCYYKLGQFVITDSPLSGLADVWPN
jgi:hypothetical protein